MIKKLLLTTLALLLILTGCTSSFKASNDAERVALAINDQLLLDTHNDKDTKLEVTKVDLKVLADYYIEAFLSVQSIDREDEALTDTQKEYLEAFEAFFYILLDKIEKEYDDIHLTHVGYNDDQGYNGIYVLEFKTPFELDQEIIDAINLDYNNNLEYLSLNQNILVIMDHGFMSDVEANMNEIDRIVKEVLTANKR